MTENSMAATLAGGGTALGAWMMLREPLVAAAAANLDYDYLCIDAQHGIQDFGEVVTMLQATTAGSSTPIVRTPWNEPGLIGRFLDAGALGIIVPMVNTREQAEAAVKACRYAPAGSRSMGPVGAGVRHGSDYFAKANEEILVIPMIETAEAVSNVDDILSVDGVDTIYVGPADLSLTLGLGPGLDNDDPAFVEAIDTILAACGRHGVTPGIHCSPPLAGKRHEQGFRMLSVGYDFGPVMAALRADIKTSRGAIQ